MYYSYMMFCSTGKPQDKDPHCLIPARLQNKRESCCFIKTTRHSVCSCLCARVRMCACLCVWFFFFFFFFFFWWAAFMLCQENDLFNIWWSGSQAVNTNVEMCCLELYFFASLLPLNLDMISKHVNHLQLGEIGSARVALAHSKATICCWWWMSPLACLCTSHWVGGFMCRKCFCFVKCL